MQLPQAPQPHFTKNIPGFAAISSIIVILALIVVIGIGVTSIALGNAQMSLGQTQGEQTLALVNACIEDAMLYYNNNSTIPLTRTLPGGSCTIVLDSSTSTSATFTTTATLNGHTRSVQVVANRTTTVSPASWVITN